MTYLYIVAGSIAATALAAAVHGAVCKRRRLVNFFDWCFEHCIDLRGLTRRELRHYAEHHQLLVHVGYDLAALGRRLAAVQQLTDMPARERLRALLLDDSSREGRHERHAGRCGPASARGSSPSRPLWRSPRVDEPHGTRVRADPTTPTTAFRTRHTRVRLGPRRGQGREDPVGGELGAQDPVEPFDASRRGA